MRSSLRSAAAAVAALVTLGAASHAAPAQTHTPSDSARLARERADLARSRARDAQADRQLGADRGAERSAERDVESERSVVRGANTDYARTTAEVRAAQQAVSAAEHAHNPAALRSAKARLAAAERDRARAVAAMHGDEHRYVHDEAVERADARRTGRAEASDRRDNAARRRDRRDVSRDRAALGHDSTASRPR